MISNLDSFESRIVTSYEGWDENGPMSYQLYKATLAIDIGPHKKGDTVDTFVFDGESSVFQIYNEGRLTVEGKAKLIIFKVNRIDADSATP